MKSIRTNPTVHAAEGDERIRTAVPAPGTDPAYEHRGEHRRVVPTGDIGSVSDRTDPDYSPAYQDEYQRLWHQAAAERDALRKALAAADVLADAYGRFWARDGKFYAYMDARRGVPS